MLTRIPNHLRRLFCAAALLSATTLQLACQQLSQERRSDTLVASAPADSSYPPVEIRFLDVGQGDAALIISPKHRYILVDAGPDANPVANYLRQNGIDTIELVVASHNHTDHIGGLRSVFKKIAVKNYMENGLPATTSTYTNLLKAVAASGARVLKAESRTINLDSMQVRILPLPPNADTQNNRSVGLLLEYGSFRALLTGDSEQSELGYWLSTHTIPDVTVVKVAHHGSWNGTTPAWVRATRPQVAVISVGAGNQYGHPSPKALTMWSRGARKILRTDLDGTIIVRGMYDGTFQLDTLVTSPKGKKKQTARRKQPAVDKDRIP